MRQSFTPQAMSNLSLNVLKPEIARCPSVVKTYSQLLIRGMLSRIFRAAFESGTVTLEPVLYLAAGTTHKSPCNSSHVIALASVRRQAVRSRKRTNCPYGAG